MENKQFGLERAVDSRGVGRLLMYRQLWFLTRREAPVYMTSTRASRKIVKLQNKESNAGLNTLWCTEMLLMHRHLWSLTCKSFSFYDFHKDFVPNLQAREWEIQLLLAGTHKDVLGCCWCRDVHGRWHEEASICMTSPRISCQAPRLRIIWKTSSVGFNILRCIERLLMYKSLWSLTHTKISSAQDLHKDLVTGTKLENRKTSNVSLYPTRWWGSCRRVDVNDRWHSERLQFIRIFTRISWQAPR